MVIFMFKPKIIYYEPGVIDYPLGAELILKYKDIPMIPIDNHNNIEELRTAVKNVVRKLYERIKTDKIEELDEAIEAL